MGAIKRLVGVTAIVAGAASIMPACADNTSMLFIRGVPVLDTESCGFTADGTSKLLLGGVVDRLFRNTYFTPVIVGNQLTKRGSRIKVDTETSRVTLRGAVVEVFKSNGESVREFTVDVAGFVDAAAGDDPSFGGAAFTALPDVASLADGTYRVDFRVFGETLGGSDVESSTYTYPVDVCTGCLISYPLDACNPLAGVSCASAYQCNGSTEGASIAVPCYLGQDYPVDCRLCAAQIPACRAP